jgi:hypothetical protein
MSSSKVDLDQLIVRSLDEQADVSQFDCGLDDVLGIDEFIHKEAMQYQNDSMGITYLFYHQNVLVGYVTVAMYAIEVKETRLRMVTSEKRYPALLLGRLGVHNGYRHRHVGLSICLWTIGLAKELSRKIGCRFVVLLTSPTKVGFYQKCGFEICPKYEKKKKVLMNLRIS